MYAKHSASALKRRIGEYSIHNRNTYTSIYSRTPNQSHDVKFHRYKSYILEKGYKPAHVHDSVMVLPHARKPTDHEKFQPFPSIDIPNRYQAGDFEGFPYGNIQHVSKLGQVLEATELTKEDRLAREILQYSLMRYFTSLSMPYDIEITHLFPFGSYVKGTEMKTSDFDLTILTNEIGNTDYSYHNLMKSWTGADKSQIKEDSDNDFVELSGHEHALFVLSQLFEHIQSKKSNAISDLELVPAIFPVLKFSIIGVNVELTVNNVAGLNESEITYHYFSHHRINRFVRLVSTWAKFHKLTGGGEQSSNSIKPKNFTLQQLIISFLIEQGLLPPVSHFLTEFDSNSVINFNKEKFRKEKAVNYEHIDSTLPPYDAEIFLTQLFFNWLQQYADFENRKIDMLQLKNGQAAFTPKGELDKRREVMIKSMVNSQNTAAYLNHGDGMENLEKLVRFASDFKNGKSIRSLFAVRSPFDNKQSRGMTTRRGNGNQRGHIELKTDGKFNPKFKNKYSHAYNPGKAPRNVKT